MTSFERGTVLAPARRQTIRFSAVPNAVVRDLERLAEALGEPITAVRRAALTAHVDFLLNQLRAHQVHLDHSLAPILTRRQPALTDRMAFLGTAHRELADRTVPVGNAARQWRESGSAHDRQALRHAVERFAGELDPVEDLDSEVLTVAFDLLGDDDWVAINRGRIRRGRPTVVARQLFWMLDGLDPRRSEALLETIPRAGMWLLRNGFSGAYNRSSYLMWQGGGNGPAV